MCLRSFFTLACLILTLTLLTDTLAAEKRVALVIGNSTYQSAPKLKNPANDALDLTASLKRLGFDVTLKNNLTYGDMRRALRDFGQRALGADMAIIYFAGHGIEVAKHNYLIPVDARLRSNLDVEYEAISLDLVMSTISTARGLRLVLLDACRNNPFATSMTVSARSRSIGRGFSRIEPSVGTLVGYAAKGGTIADDGEGRNSPYTKALLTNLEKPGLEVNFLFRKVRDQVLKETNGQQEPFTYGSLPGKKIFLKAPQANPQTAHARENDISADVTYWKSVRHSTDATIVRSYIERFPSGRFVFLARARLRQLDDAENNNNAASAREHERQRADEERRLQEEARAHELIAWHKVRSSRDTAELQAFVDIYPAGAFTDLARARLEALQRIRSASNQPATADDQLEPATNDGAAERPDPQQLALELQRGLNRVGCNAGRPDGKWGRNSRRALQAFARYTRVRIANLSPSERLLAIVNNHRQRACPVGCGPRERASGNRCVPKTCDRGKELDSNGGCVEKRGDRSSKKKLVCSRRHRVKGNRCVLKTCGKGKTLDRKGNCFAKLSVPKNVPLAKKRSKQGQAKRQCGRCWLSKANQWDKSHYCGTAFEWRNKAGLCQ